MNASLPELTATFSKIGLFTIGGGYAMIPLIEHYVVERNKWVEKEEFLDLLALAQSAPGVFAVNIAIFIGYKLRGLKGAIFAAYARQWLHWWRHRYSLLQRLQR